MSKKPKTIAIYSLADFQKADRLDRIRMHMIEPDRFALSHDDFEYYQQLQQSWMLVSNEMRESVSIRIIQNQVYGAESWYKATTILRDIETLFAPFLERNREMQKRKVIERMYLYAEKAHEKAICKQEDGTEYVDGDWMDRAQKFLKDAADMEGLGAAGALVVNPDELIIPEIEITSDPTAFLEAQTADLGDYDFDELEDEDEEAFEDED